MKPSFHERLTIALGASKPIADPPRQPLEVEMLLTKTQRRTCTVQEHADFRASLNPQPEEADEL